MKPFYLFLFLLAFTSVQLTFAAEPIPDPFIELTVNGQIYKNGDKIETRPGERLKVTAAIQGGRRYYCSMPEKYANIGKTTEIVSKGDDGMFFTVQGGSQFRGEWKLANETAMFSSSGEVTIEPLPQQGIKQTDAFITLPKSGISQTYLKVRVNTLWKYERKTPAGITNQEEENKAEASFTLVLSTVADGWYSSENIVVSGTEDFSLRNKIDQIQRFYKEIETALLAKNFNGARMHITNLQTSLNTLKSEIERLKREKPGFECNVSLMGSPSDLSMDNLNKLEKMSDLWKTQYDIASENTLKINQLLLNKQMGLTTNIMKSVLKNYIEWGTSLPSDWTDFVASFDLTSTANGVLMPVKMSQWYESAGEDSSILKDQAMGIKMLSELREFYQERTKLSVEERKQLINNKNELLPVKAMDAQLKAYLGSLTWLKWLAGK